MKITKILDNEVTCYLNNSELEEYGLNVNEDTVNNENLKDKAVQNFFDLTLAVRDEIAKEYGLPVQCVEYIDMTPEYNGATLRYSLNDSTAGAYSYLNQVLGEVTEYLSGSVEKLKQRLIFELVISFLSDTLSEDADKYFKPDFINIIKEYISKENIELYLTEELSSAKGYISGETVKYINSDPAAKKRYNDAVKKQINQVVGGKNGTRFISSIVSAVQSTPALQECTSPSIVNAALLGEALNLSPSPQLGQFYMVPFDNKKKGCKEAQFQLGYKGYIQLAIRSGYYKKLNVLAIKEGELVRYDPLDEEVEVNLIDDDILREEAPTMGYFAMFEYENGFRKTLYWSKKKMLAHAEKYSFAFYKNGGAKSLELLEQGKIPEKDMWKYSSFWFKDFDGMALKTMLRQLISKWGIMSIDLQNAIDKDMAVIHEDGKTDYVDAVKAEDDGVVSDQELQEVQEDQPAAPGTQQPDPNGIEASFFG